MFSTQFRAVTGNWCLRVFKMEKVFSISLVALDRLSLAMSHVNVRLMFLKVSSWITDRPEMFMIWKRKMTFQ